MGGAYQGDRGNGEAPHRRWGKGPPVGRALPVGRIPPHRVAQRRAGGGRVVGVTEATQHGPVRGFLAALSRSPLGVAGAALTSAAALVILTLFALELVGFHGGPYVGILAYLVLPALFVCGLLLIPLGVARQRRRQRRGESETGFPVLDFNRAKVRRLALLLALLTAVNAVVLALATYKGVEVMESTEFCAEACHTVMEPQATAHRAYPHAAVACVDCHVGPGAASFVEAKLAGARQVWEVAWDVYPRPVPSPVHGMRPASETCGGCHRAGGWTGDRAKTFLGVEDDEASTLTETVLDLHVGGVAPDGTASGIHWHDAVEIRYQSDAERETIYAVELTTPDGATKRYEPPAPPPAGAVLAWRTMDCTDCHNRAAHGFETADRALARAFHDGRLDPSLPYLARHGRELLAGEYGSHQAARREIPRLLAARYDGGGNGVDGAAVERAGALLAELWAANVFPRMNVTWGTYPNHLGHEDSPGCFRCHDDEHATADGEVIAQDCEGCHSL